MHPLEIAIHVAAGTAAIAAGAAALVFRKGGRRHVVAGQVFTAAMLVMGIMGSEMAASKGDPVTALAGLLAAYLVLTGWRSARRTDGEAGGFEAGALLGAVAMAGAFLLLGAYAASRPGGHVSGYGPGICYVFGGFVALAAALDLNFILRGRLQRRQRVARHLWRMCAALFLAAASFFLGQQKVMPPEIRGWWGLFVPPLGTLAAMAWWLVRTRFGGRRPSAPGEARPGLAAERV